MLADYTMIHFIINKFVVESRLRNTTKTYRSLKNQLLQYAQYARYLKIK